MRKSLPANSRRGAVILFFILVALPLIWVAAALSVDYARVRMATSEAQQVANAAANAAAPIAGQKTTPLEAESLEKTSTLSPEGTARDLIETACKHGAAVKAAVTDNCATVADAADVSVAKDGSSVTVEIEYRIDGLVFLDILDRFVNSNVNSTERYFTATVSATSYACPSGSDSSSCFRPAR